MTLFSPVGPLLVNERFTGQAFVRVPVAIAQLLHDHCASVIIYDTTMIPGSFNHVVYDMLLHMLHPQHEFHAYHVYQVLVVPPGSLPEAVKVIFVDSVTL